MFVFDKQFKPSVIFVGKANSLPKSGATERSFAWDAVSSRLGWKGFPWTNTLAYKEYS